MVPGQAQSGWKAVIGYVCSLDDTSISFLFFSAELRVESWAYAHWANTGQTPSHISSPFHGHSFSFFSLCMVVCCLH